MDKRRVLENVQRERIFVGEAIVRLEDEEEKEKASADLSSVPWGDANSSGTSFPNSMAFENYEWKM